MTRAASTNRDLFQKVWNTTRRLAEEGCAPKIFVNRRVFDVGLLVGRSDLGSFGVPFPSNVARPLAELCDRLSNTFPFLDVMKPAELHATLFSIYRDKPPTFPLEYPKEKRLQDYAQIISIIKTMKPIRVQWQGVNITPDGTVIVEGHLSGLDLDRLRARLHHMVPLANGTKGSFFHISLARLRKPITVNHFRKLLDWVQSRRQYVVGPQVIKRAVLVATRDHAGHKIYRRWQSELR